MKLRVDIVDIYSLLTSFRETQKPIRTSISYRKETSFACCLYIKKIKS